MGKEKIVVFVACGKVYQDEYAQVRAQVEWAARNYAARGFVLRNNFLFEEFEDRPRCGIDMDPMFELAFFAGTMAERGPECYRLVIQDACAAVAVCDGDDPEQLERFATLMRVCAEQNCHLRKIVYHSQDWSPVPS